MYQLWQEVVFLWQNLCKHKKTAPVCRPAKIQGAPRAAAKKRGTRNGRGPPFYSAHLFCAARRNGHYYIHHKHIVAQADRKIAAVLFYHISDLFEAETVIVGAALGCDGKVVFEFKIFGAVVFGVYT